MLGQHPQAYGVPELNLFVADTVDMMTDAMRAIRQQRLHGLLRTVAQLYSGEQSLRSLEMARRWVLNRNHCNTGDVYRELCCQVAPRRIFDKSPLYVANSTQYLKRINETFPDAYYIHLVRHPKSQGRSMMNISEGLMAILGNSFDCSTVPPTIDPQYWWYDIQLNILEFLKNIKPSHQMFLRGEDVLNDPKFYFEEISRWLGFDWNESILEVMLRPQDSPYACLGPYSAHYGNDPNFLKSPMFKQRSKSDRPQAVDSLEGPLPWRSDGKDLTVDVVRIAKEFGYE
jgi:hypothetical protein